ncbi:MAG: DUF2723 domain-containing protein [Bacteroidetes bacterium]|jgi:hypothetical protein|nr:DUF2723 domain-containing protein [Bacteroidota bacterium]
MKKYTFYNNLFGWVAFAVAAFVYLMTIEPTTSLWDCGEFIASAYKLQVGHPPGAPFFMIMARFFSLFTSDPANVAKMVNAMSGLASAFTILFLFWTITYFAKRIVSNDQEPSGGSLIAIIGAGLIGAWAYTFSDTFWFSAVEGEVYASSSLFTAAVFWAILKWEKRADNPHSLRWIILIAYLVGLSIGVHLLNLLAIPAIVLVYYFKKYETSTKGIIASIAISIFLLAAIMYGIIPGIVKMASHFELLFVNSMGMGFKSGVLVFSALLIGSLIYGIYLTHKTDNSPIRLAIVITLAVLFMGIPLMGESAFLAVIIMAAVFGLVYYFGKQHKEVLNAVLVSFTVIIIGYSSFAMIVIRSNANPPMDENNPETVFSLLSYLNREQYGDRPLFYGHYYNAPAVEVEDGDPVYNQIGDRYEITDYKRKVVYDERFNTFFPRMYSSDQNHIRVYKQWADIEGEPIVVRQGAGETKTLKKPTFGENIKFFLSYQVGFMYWRYFMWNFAGRQNDNQNHSGSMNDGNWISGIPFIDRMIEGPQTKQPDSVKNHPARNTYYFLPLILGLIGLIYQLQRRKEGFWIVMTLFILTGLAIVVYLNQTPIQPRERDYAYAGSFYAFSVWIGLGVLSIYEALSKRMSKKVSAVIAMLVSLSVPTILATENWDDHDRSGRYTARAYAHNYLMTCPENAILFTNGDNDTFPLWYIQDVEGVRTDVRVVNLMLLNTDWYIDQMSRKAYGSDRVPFSLSKDQYRQGTRDRVFLRNEMDRFINVDQAMEFVASDNPRTKLSGFSGERYDFIPSKKLILDVEKDNVLKYGVVAPEDSALIVDEIRWNLNRNHLSKSDLMVFDLLAQNDWKRPIYFVSIGHGATLGLEDYLQFDGFAYRLVPIKTTPVDQMNKGRVKTDVLYKNLMEVYEWGRMNEPDVYLDHFNRRTLNVIRFRSMYTRLAQNLVQENKIDSAVQVLDYCLELGPHEKFPYDLFIVPMIETYYEAGAFEKGNALADEYGNICDQNLIYYMQFSPMDMQFVDQDIRYNMEMLNRMVRITNQFNQTEMHESLKERFDKHINSYRLRKGGSAMQ